MKLPPGLAARCLELAGVNPCEGLSESKFQAKVIAEAKRLGWESYHTFDSRRSEAGFPDLLMIRGPVLIVAELKVGKNKTTADQEKWLNLFAGVPGAKVFRWRPEHWAQIKHELETADGTDRNAQG